MDKRKGIILAVVLFLFVGLGTYVFAGSNNEDKPGNGSTNTTDKGGNTPDVDENTNNGKEEEGKEEENKANGTTNNSGTNLVVDNSYENALNALNKAKNTYTKEDIDNAKNLINKVTNETSKNNLYEELNKVEDTYNAEQLVKELINKVNASGNKEDINTARGFESANKVNEVVKSLVESTKKNELVNLLNDVNIILEDNTNPVISGINDKDITNKDVSLVITDTNEYKILLNNKEVSKDKIENIVLDGKYEVIVVDKAYNESKISFEIDKTLPKVTFANTHNYNKFYNYEEIAIIIDDVNLDINSIYYTWNNTNKYVDATNKLDSSKVTKNEDGTYKVLIPTVEGRNRLHIKVSDKALNELTTYSKQGKYNIDKTVPTITLKKWSQDNNHIEVTPGVHNYCVVAEASDANLKTITLNGKEYNNGDIICDTNDYVLKAIDKANLDASIEFSIDRTYGVVTINDKDSYNTYDVTTINKYNKIDKITFSEEGMVRLTKDNQVVLFGDSNSFNYTFTDGTYKFEFFDKGGNNTVFMFKFDATSPEVKELRINSSYENKEYTNELYSIGIYLTTNEHLGKNPTFIIDGIKYNANQVNDKTNQYAVVTKLPKTTTQGEIKFSILVEDEFGNTNTFTNEDIKNDVNYNRVIFDNVLPSINILGTTGSKYWLDKEDIPVIITEENIDSVYYIFNQSNNDKSMTNALNSKDAIKVDSKDIIKNEDGTYKVLIPLNKEGRYVLNVRVIDKVGNKKDARKGWYQIDNENPIIEESYVKSNTSSVTINVKDETTKEVRPQEFLVVDGYTSDKNLKVTIKAKDSMSGIAGIYISEEDNTSNASWITPNKDGIYDYTLNSDINGTRVIYVFVKDKAGHITKTELSIIYDNEPAVINHKNNIIKNGETYYYNNRFNAKAEDSSGINVMTLNNSIRVALNISGMGYTYTYKIVDKAGNIGTYKIILDNVSPIISDVVEGGVYPKGVTPVISDDKLLDKVVLTKDGVEVEYTNGNTIKEEGNYILTATDKAGNEAKVCFRVGKINTTIKLTGPSSLVYDKNAKVFSAMLIDEFGNTVEGISLTPVYIDAAGNRADAINAGEYEVRVYFAGNETYKLAYVTSKFTITKSTPKIELTEPSSLVYDGQEKAYGIKVTGVNNEEITSLSGMSVVYKDKETGKTLSSAPVNVGTYILGIYFRETNNYTRADKWITFEILPTVELNGKGYGSLNEAINDALDNDKIVLVENISEDIVVPVGKNIVIDLNNKTINGNKTITNNGTISIINGTIKSTNNGIINNGTINKIDNVTINADRTGINNKGTITEIINTNIESVYYPIYNSGSARIEKLANNNVMGHYMDGIYVADDSTIGEIVSGTYYTDGMWKEGSSVAGFGLYISTNAKIEKISGGNFKGSKAAVANYGEILSITGGEFEKKYDNTMWELSWTFLYSGQIKNISGGKFYSYNNKVANGIFRSNNYTLVSGYEFVKDGDFFTVEKTK